MELAVSYQDEASVIRDLAPLVKVEGERVGAFDSLKPRGKIGSEYGKRAVGSIDMEPETFTLAEVGERREIVDGTSVDRARAAYHHERSEAVPAIVVDGLFQSFDVDAMATVGGDHPQGIAAEAGDIHRLADTPMHGGGAISCETLGIVRNTLLPNWEAEFYVAGYDYGDQVCHRVACDKQSSRRVGKTEELTHPTDNLSLDFNGSMVATAKVRVQSCGEHLRQHANRRAATMYPTHEARVNVPYSERQDVLHDLVMDCAKIRWQSGNAAAKLRPNRIRDGLPDGTFSNVLYVID